MGTFTFPSTGLTITGFVNQSPPPSSPPSSPPKLPPTSPAPSPPPASDLVVLYEARLTHALTLTLKLALALSPMPTQF